MIILGIESTCDETAAAIVKNGSALVSSVVSSQIDLFAELGGVVPEVAARAHTERIIPVIAKCLADSGLTIKEIDAVAVSAGPGLMGALMIGLNSARALALIWNKPLIAVQHVKAHLYANFLSNQKVALPAIGLVASGGHTSIIYLDKNHRAKVLGQTLDDAAGEAFDKVGSLLHLPYPAGPVIDKLAQSGNAQTFFLPQGLKNRGLNFSFSGLKTAVSLLVQKLEKDNQLDSSTNDLCASFQKSVAEVLVSKTMQAVQVKKTKTLLLGGGVIANTYIRAQFEVACKKQGIKLHVPPIKFCTDNAVNIAASAYFMAKSKQYASPISLSATPDLVLK